MIPRILLVALALELFLVSTISQSQNSRSYDTNEWIPISPPSASSKETAASPTEEPPQPRKAQGRVLNLDAPAQKFFPEEEYRYLKRRQHHTGYQKQKDRYQLENGYKFEVPPPLPSPSGSHKGPLKYQYFTNQEVKLPIYEQPPPLEQYNVASYGHQNLVPQPQLAQKPLLVPPPTVPQFLRMPPAESAPLPNAPNNYQLYNLPFNDSFYQSLNPGSINQELLGAIQHQNFEDPGRVVPNGEVKDEKQSVQLVYVPLENLKPKQPVSQGSQSIYRQVDSPLNLKSTSNNHRLADIQNDFIQQALQAHKLQEQIQLGQPILLEKSTTTTHKPPKKRKPHQPPLAVYVESDKSADITDVVEALKEAKTISVQDNIHPGSPEIFIGPSTLTPTEGYTKFPLPYLNNLDGKRVDRRVDELPFFVAPLSFKPPPGYSKIPLPSPHVGSVVISNRNEQHDKKATTKQNVIHKQTYTTPKPSVHTTAYGQSLQFTGNQPYYQDNRQHYTALPNQHMVQFSVNKEIEQLSVPVMDRIQQQRPQQQVNVHPSTKPYHQQQVSVQQNIQSYKQQPVNVQPTTKTLQQQLTGETYYTGSHVVNVPKTQKVKQQHGAGANNQLYSYDENLYQTTPRVALNIPQGISTESYVQVDNNKYTNSLRNPQQYEAFPGTEHKLKTILQNEYAVSSTPPVITSTHPAHSSVSADFIPIQPTAETSGPEQIINNFFSENQKKKEIIDINPLELAINKFELQQINSKLVERPRVKDQAYYEPEISENEEDSIKYETGYQLQTTKPKPRDQYNFNADLHRFVSTPATILRDLDVQTTVHTTKKPRRRIRPTKPPTTALPISEKETYTVLEEFSVKQPNHKDHAVQLNENGNIRDTYDIQTTANYDTMDKIVETTYNNGQTTGQEYSSAANDNENINRYSVNKPIYKYQQTSSQPDLVDSYTNKKLTNGNIENARRQNVENYGSSTPHVPNYSQDYKYETTTRSKPNYSQQEYDTSTQREPNYSQEYKDYDTSNRRKPNYSEQEYQISTPLQQSPYYEQYDQQNSEPNSPKEREQIVQQYQTQSYYEQQGLQSPVRNKEQVQQGYQVGSIQYDYDPSIQPLVHNRGEHQKPQQPQQSLQEDNRYGYGGVSEYDSTLQDPSVRSLLVPHLLVPTLPGTTRNHVTAEPIVEDVIVTSTTPTTTTTTEVPETTTHGRTRGRQRGGNRFSNAATTTRRSVVRRRPTSRFTTERTRQPTEVNDLQRTATKQRFRTRGRVTTNTVAERSSTTENEIHDGPASEAAEPQSYMQFENAVSELPNVNDYQNVYLSQPSGPGNIRPVFQYDNTAPLTTPKAIVDVKITHPIEGNERYIPTSRPNTEIYESRTESHASHRIEETTRHPVKIRGRPRIKSKFHTTTETITTRRPVKESSENEEFFGFIRQPNFNHAYQSQVAVATHQPTTLYTPSLQNHEDYYDNPEVDTTTVHFIGELRPKYHTTTPIYETTVEPETEAPKQKKRQRIRPSSQRKSSNRSSQEGSVVKTTLQPSRRSNVIRSRGRVQYKAPVNLKQPSDEGADVEGGNYPVNFLANRPSSTSAPSFKITIDPQDTDDEDQSPYSSIYRPRVIPGPEEWHEASAYSITNEDNNNVEEIGNEDNDNLETTPKITTSSSTSPDQPIAQPMKSSEEIDNKSSEETYKQNTKAIEDQFEAVNNFDKPDEPARKASNSRRRGVWKLVRHRPVDKYEVAESQNYLSVLNSFDEIKKENKNEQQEQQSYVNYNPSLEQNSAVFDYESHKISKEPLYVTEKQNYYNTDQFETERDGGMVTTVLPKTESDQAPQSNGDFLESIYDMFGLGKQQVETTTNITKFDEETVNPTTYVPTFPDEITELPDSSNKHNNDDESTTLPSAEISTATNYSAIKSYFGVEPWQMRAVRTSTSTEVSHETEICYKGRCIKSHDKKTRP